MGDDREKEGSLVIKVEETLFLICRFTREKEKCCNGGRAVSNWGSFFLPLKNKETKIFNL